MSNTVINLVTTQLIELMSKGIKPWVKEWKNGSPRYGSAVMPTNIKTGTKYSGFNLLTLMAAQHAGCYESPYWVTANQAKEIGGHVRKGERGTMVLYCAPSSKLTCARCDAEYYAGKKSAPRCPQCGSDETNALKQSRTWRYYNVFNIAQVDGIATPEAPPELPEFQRLEQAEALLKNSGARIHHGGNRACYSPSADDIHLPHPEQFTSPVAYYATALHELTHWTGHHSRLNRDLANAFGTQAYAFEELIAEMGSAFVCAALGIPSDLQNHANYLNNWQQILKEKPGALVEAASKAGKAFELIQNFSAAPAQPAPVPVAQPAQPEPTAARRPIISTKKRHGVERDERQDLLENLVAVYLSAPTRMEYEEEQARKKFSGLYVVTEPLNIQYKTATYRIANHRDAIAHLMRALGFGTNVKELEAAAA